MPLRNATEKLDLVLAGVSVRAAAQSAQRAGLRVLAVDRFGDLDTREAASSWYRLPSKLSRQAVCDLVRLAPTAPLCWTSPFENYTRALEALSNSRQVWGASPDAVRLVRSPQFLAELLREVGVAFPRLLDPRELSRWQKPVLEKPLRGGGGIGIRFVRQPRAEGRRRGRYWQEFVNGRSISGLFWSEGRDAVLLCVSEQLVGVSELNGRGFLYCGSIVPAEADKTVEEPLQRAARAIVTRTGLRGLFGIDAIVSEDSVYVLEVNPRWTASVELYERLSGTNALLLHASAFDCRFFAVPAPVSTRSRVIARGIVYASRDGRARQGTEGRQWLARGQGDWWLADLPCAGTRVRAGQPLVSIITEGPDREDVWTKLVHLAPHVERGLLE